MTIGDRVRHGLDSGEVVGIDGDCVTVLLYTRKAVIAVAAYELEVTATEEEAEALERIARRPSRGHSGWRLGTPQCDGCRRILKGYNQPCPSCGGYSRPRDGARAGGG